VQSADGNKLQLFNAPGPRRAPGAEVLIHYVVGPLQAIGSWSYIDATEASLSGLRQAAPLVPRQSVRPSPGLGGNPITEVWAPLEGRTFNIGIRAEL
jgi:hypothetical protein